MVSLTILLRSIVLHAWGENVFLKADPMGGQLKITTGNLLTLLFEKFYIFPHKIYLLFLNHINVNKTLQI